jgi:hypothetical protein
MTGPNLRPNRRYVVVVNMRFLECLYVLCMIPFTGCRSNKSASNGSGDDLNPAMTAKQKAITAERKLKQDQQ